MLGFIPRWSLQEGIKQVITALESGEIKDYQHPMYSNVKFLGEEANSHLIRRENGWASELINEEVGPRMVSHHRRRRTESLVAENVTKTEIVMPRT